MENSSNYYSAPHPDLKPDYASSFSNASRQFKNFGWSLLWATLAYIAAIVILEIPVFILTYNPNYSTYPNSNFGWMMPYSIFIGIVSIVLLYGYILASLKAARGEKPQVVDIFRPFTRFFPVIFSAILWYLIIFVGFILLIIPGIFFMCRLIFVPYLIVDRKAGVFKAIAGSWDMARGHFWTIFLLGLTAFVAVMIIEMIIMLAFFPSMMTYGGTFPYGELKIALLFFLILIVIFLPFSMYIMLLFGSLYNAIQLERNPVNPAGQYDVPASPQERW